MGDEVQYTNISLRRGEHATIRLGDPTLWTMNGPFSLEFTVGALLAGNFAINKVNPSPVTHGRERFYQYYFTAIEGDDVYPTYSWNIVNDSRMEIVTVGSRQNFNIHRASIGQLCEIASKSGFHIWLEDVKSVSLFNFKTMEFLRGIFTMLTAFDIDYREMLISAPLILIPTYRANQARNYYRARYYQIEGYPLPFLPRHNGGPFTTNIHNIEMDYAICEEIVNK